MANFYTLICVVALLVAVASATRMGAPWPTFKADHFRSGSSPSLSGPSTCGVLWDTGINGNVGSNSPSIGYNGVIFLASAHTQHSPPLWAIDESDGSIIWTSNVSSSVALPTVDPTGTYVFVPSELNCIAALQTQDGTEVWRSCTGGLISTSPLVTTSGDTVIVTAYVESGPTVFAYDISTGDEVWSLDVGAPAGGSPALGPDGITLYFCTRGEDTSGVIAIDLNTTDVAWNWTAPSHGFNHLLKTPAVGPAGLVYVNGDDGYLYALDDDDGTLIWKASMGHFRSSQQQSTPAVSVQGDIVFVGMHQYIVAFDSLTGKLLWNYTTGGNVRSSPAVDNNNNVFIGSDDGHVYAINGNTGRLLWAFNAADSVSASLAISSKGTLVVATETGALYALNEAGTSCAHS